MSDQFMRAAIDEAKIGLDEGGIPIGAVLSMDRLILGRGHNQRVQKGEKGSVVLHAEMACLENAGRRNAKHYRFSTMVTTLSPCWMCAGAIVLYKIPRVVIGDNINFQVSEDFLRSHGVEVIVINDPEAIGLMYDFITEHPELWAEDIGE